MFAESIDFTESTCISILQAQSNWKIHETGWLYLLKEILLFYNSSNTLKLID
jgi:hypothetical protein